MSTPKEILNRYTEAVEATIQEVLGETLPFLQEVSRYHLGWVDRDFQPIVDGRGKMLRSTLHLLVFEALYGDYRPALPAAAALEIVHNFSLVHDDVEDNGTERRGRPTVWTIWGKERAINIGDFLFALAFKCLHQLDLTLFPPQTVLEVFRIMSDSCVALTEGQDLDMNFQAQSDVSVGMYLDMIYRKTGALIEASVLTGAKLATSDKEVVQTYHTFARHIGLAFQIQDDFLGIWGEADQLGKSITTDLLYKKKTLPIIYTMSQLMGTRGETLRNYYNTPDPLTESQLVFVQECLDIAEAKRYTQNVVSEYHEQAFTALKQVASTHEAYAHLMTLAQFLVHRTY